MYYICPDCKHIFLLHFIFGCVYPKCRCKKCCIIKESSEDEFGDEEENIKVEFDKEKSKLTVNMTVPLMTTLKYYTVSLKPPEGVSIEDFYDTVKQVVDEMNEEENE